MLCSRHAGQKECEEIRADKQYLRCCPSKLYETREEKSSGPKPCAAVLKFRYQHQVRSCCSAPHPSGQGYMCPEELRLAKFPAMKLHKVAFQRVHIMRAAGEVRARESCSARQLRRKKAARGPARHSGDVLCMERIN